MKKSLFICFILFSITCFSQNNGNVIRKNSTYMEGYLLGSNDIGGHVSLNYDRKIGKRDLTLLRAGFAPSFHSTVFHVPTTIGWITGPRKKHHFEGAIGLSNRIEFYNGKVNYTPFTQVDLMYRYESYKGFLLRAGINYVSFLFFIGKANLALSLGYRF